MSDTPKTEKPAATTKPVRPIPENLPEELLPVFDWWHAQGRQTVYLAVVMLVIIGAAFLLNQNRKTKIRQAAERLLAAQSPDELEDLTRQYGRTGAGHLGQLLLAKKHYDAGRYDDAQACYAEFLKRKAPARFADIAVLGQAHTLEAKGDIQAARATFAAFRREKPGHYLAPQALMGEARCLAMAGDKAAATDLLDLLIAEKADTPWEEQATDLKALVARYEKRAPVSLFDQADSILPSLTPETTLFTDPTAEPTMELATELIKPMIEPEVEPAVEPADEPAIESAVEPADEPAIEPAVEPADEPAIEPAVEPADEPAVEPAVEPADEPAIEPAVEP